MVLLIASQHAQLTALIVILTLGFLVGIAGHTIRASWLILTGILMIGAASAYFLVYVATGSH